MYIANDQHDVARKRLHNNRLHERNLRKEKQVQNTNKNNKLERRQSGEENEKCDWLAGVSDSFSQNKSWSKPKSIITKNYWK